MLKHFAFSILHLFLIFNQVLSFDWNHDSINHITWSEDCDFSKNDFLSFPTPKNELCSIVCSTNIECTHYSWNNFNGGTCKLKNGTVSKNSANFVKGSECGFVDYSQNDNFFIIAHMCNNPKAIDKALKSGANAIEIDLVIDKSSGDPIKFEHGFPCDCCAFTNSSLCGLLSCGGSSNAKNHLNYVAAKYPNLPLIYVDSKTNDLSNEVQKKAGQKVIDMIISNLIDKGYKGQILLNSPNEQEYIKAAANYVSQTKHKSRFFFTLDEQDADVAIKFLKSIPTRNIIYSTSFKRSCFIIENTKQINIAYSYMMKNEISSLFAFTIDRERSFKSAYNAGARGIITNDPLTLYNWTKKFGINLAQLNDNTLTAQ